MGRRERRISYRQVSERLREWLLKRITPNHRIQIIVREDAFILILHRDTMEEKG